MNEVIISFLIQCVKLPKNCDGQLIYPGFILCDINGAIDPNTNLVSSIQKNPHSKMKNTALFLYLNILVGALLGAFCFFSDSFLDILVTFDVEPVSRNLGLIGLGVVIIFSLVLVIYYLKPAFIDRFLVDLKKDRVYFLLNAGYFLLLLESIQDIIFFFSDIQPPHYAEYFRLLGRIYPILFWLSIHSILAIIFLYRLKLDGKRMSFQSFLSKEMRLAILVNLVFVMGMRIVGSSYVPNTNKFEVGRYTGTFLPVEIPILGIQVILIFGAILLLWVPIAFIKKKLNGRFSTFLLNTSILFLIWFTAFSVWRYIPVEKSTFTDIVPDPGNQVYPSSDSFYYDKEALRLLDGENFSEDSTHVLYSFFLSGLHAIKGFDYLDIILLQIGVFSLIPVMVYLIASNLESQFAGLFIAALYILRERSGLLLASELSTGAVVNQLMTENFALLLLLIILLNLIKLTDREDKKVIDLVLLGGLIGLSLLVRIDLLAAYIAISAGFLIIMWNQKRQWLLGIAVISVAAILVISPWIYRYSQSTGYLSMDKGGFISKRVSEYVNSIKLKSGLDELDQGADHASGSDYGGWYRGDIRNLPKHISNSLVMSVLYLPNSHQPFLTIGSFIELDDENGIQLSRENGVFSERYIERYIRSSPYYWYIWDGILPLRSVIPLSLTLIVLAVGICRVRRAKSKIAFILFLAMLGHFSVMAFAGFSGGRFIKSFDWLPLVFYGIGLSYIFLYLFSALDLNPHALQENDFRTQIDFPQFADSSFMRALRLLSFILIIGIGWGPTILEAIIPQKFTQLQLEDYVSEMALSRNTDRDQDLIFGRALYPRFYLENERPSDNRKGTTPDPTIQRIDFYIVGTDDIWVSLPMDDPVKPFPHGSIVIVEGTRTTLTNDTIMYEDQKPYILAQRVYVLSDIFEADLLGVFETQGSIWLIDQEQ